jgi:glycosyltransferase involved in cell wall biosynthesis
MAVRVSMRVTVDASSLLVASAGIKTYTWNLLRGLRKLGHSDEISAFPYLPEIDHLEHSSSVLPWWQTIPRLALLYAVNHSSHLLDKVLAGADVFHATNLVRQIPRAVRVTATIHDVTSWIMPEVHLKSTVMADQLFADRVLPHAARLIANSEHTRMDAIRVLGVPPEKIDVIYPGVNPAYFQAKAAARAQPYVLFVGAIEPRKNIETLLDAWEQMPADLRSEFDLVLAGPLAWAPQSTVARIRVTGCYLGYVAESDLPGLFAGATAFVFPSLYEGFGFPVAQAMAAGIPVVTSNVSSLPEIAGDAALLIDPHSAGEIGSALKRLLVSESLRQELGTRGRLRAQEFQWEIAASRFYEFFRLVVSGVSA